MNRKLFLLGILTALSMLSARAFTQERQTPETLRTNRDREVTRGDEGSPAADNAAQNPVALKSGSALDREIASFILPCNEGEMTLARVAEQQSQNPRVKQFAQQMIKAHTELEGKLRSFAGRVTAVNSAGDEREVTNRVNNGEKIAREPAGVDVEAGPVSVRTGAVAEPNMSESLNFVAINKQIANRLVASFQRDLEQKHGAEFDKCYIGQQIAAHQHVLDACEVCEQYASPQLRTVLVQGARAAQAHLDEAKQIMRTLEGTNETRQRS